MKKDTKKKMLTNVAKMTEYVAIKGGSFPTWLGFHEPKMPEELRDIIRNRKK